MSSRVYGFSTIENGAECVALGESVFTCIGPTAPMCMNSDAEPGPPL